MISTAFMLRKTPIFANWVEYSFIQSTLDEFDRPISKVEAKK